MRALPRLLAAVFSSLLLVTPVAHAQMSDAQQQALEAKGAECEALAAAGDYVAMQACVTELQAMTRPLQEQFTQQYGGDPDLQRMIEADAAQRAMRDRAQQAERDRRQATAASRQAARDCTDLVSDFRPAGAGQREWTFRYTSACSQPVTVHLCVVDGPDQPSNRRQARLAPGGSQTWVMNFSDAYESPLMESDACFDPANCQQAGPRNCSG